MRIYKRIFGWDVTFDNYSRCGWSHLKLHRYRERGMHMPTSYHLIWGKLALKIDKDYLIEYTVCPYCYEDVKSNGDVSYCGECYTVEGDWITGTEEELERMRA